MDLLPKRVCITPLLPGSSVPPALQLSHAGVRQQLVAHTGAAMARVLEELRLAAACSGVCVSLKDTMQQVRCTTAVFGPRWPWVSASGGGCGASAWFHLWLLRLQSSSRTCMPNRFWVEK